MDAPLSPAPPSYETSCLYLSFGPEDMPSVPDGSHFYSYLCRAEYAGTSGNGANLTLATVGPLRGFFTRMQAENPTVYDSARTHAKRFIKRRGRLVYRCQTVEGDPLLVPERLEHLAASCPNFCEGLHDVIEACERHRPLKFQRKLSKLVHLEHRVYLVNALKLLAYLTEQLANSLRRT